MDGSTGTGCLCPRYHVRAEGQLRGHWQTAAAIDEDISDMQKSAQVRVGWADNRRVARADCAGDPSGSQSRSAGIRNLKSQIEIVCIRRRLRSARAVGDRGTGLSVSNRSSRRTSALQAGDQAQPWRTVDMQVQGNRCQASIPGEYSDSLSVGVLLRATQRAGRYGCIRASTRRCQTSPISWCARPIQFLLRNSVSPGGIVKAAGLGDGPTHGKVAIAKLRLTMPPRLLPCL